MAQLFAAASARAGAANFFAASRARGAPYGWGTSGDIGSSSSIEQTSVLEICCRYGPLRPVGFRSFLNYSGTAATVEPPKGLALRIANRITLNNALCLRVVWHTCAKAVSHARSTTTTCPEVPCDSCGYSRHIKRSKSVGGGSNQTALRRQDHRCPILIASSAQRNICSKPRHAHCLDSFGKPNPCALWSCPWIVALNVDHKQQVAELVVLSSSFLVLSSIP